MTNEQMTAIEPYSEDLSEMTTEEMRSALVHARADAVEATAWVIALEACLAIKESTV